MGSPRRRALAAGDPPGAGGLSQGDHIPQAGPQVVPLLDDSPPGRPHHRIRCAGENVGKGPHILTVQLRVAGALHIVGGGGPLGIDVEHDEGVKAAVAGDALHAFQGGIQRTGPGGRGVDAHADQRLFPPCTQNVPVLGVGVGDEQPLVHVVVPVGLPGQRQLAVKGDIPQLADIHGGYMGHNASFYF